MTCLIPYQPKIFSQTNRKFKYWFYHVLHCIVLYVLKINAHLCFQTLFSTFNTPLYRERNFYAKKHTILNKSPWLCQFQTSSSPRAFVGHLTTFRVPGESICYDKSAWGVGQHHNQLYLSVLKIRSSFLITDFLPCKMWKTWVGKFNWNTALLKRIRALFSIHRLPRLCKCLLCESRMAGGFVVLWMSWQLCRARHSIPKRLAAVVMQLECLTEIRFC